MRCQHHKGLSSFTVSLICYKGVHPSACGAQATKYPWHIKEVIINDTITPATYRVVVNRLIKYGKQKFEGIIFHR